MKRLYWIAFIYTFGWIVLEVIGSYLDARFPETDRWISSILTYAYFGVFFYLISRKTPVTLTEEEMQAPVPERQDFSPKITRRMRWKGLIIGIPAFFALLFLLPFTYIGMYDFFKGTPFMEALIEFFQIELILLKSISFWVVMIALGIMSVIGHKRMARNKYIIDGDTLIVQENTLLKAEEEIRIPLDTIDEVYMRFNGTGFSGLYLNVQGIKRRLNTSTDSLALGKAILQHKRALV